MAGSERTKAGVGDASRGVSQDRNTCFGKDFDFQLKEHGRPLKCSKNGAWKNCVSDLCIVICPCRSNAVIHVVSDLYGDNGSRVPS